MFKKLLFLLTFLSFLGLQANAAEERRLLDVDLSISGNDWKTTYYILLDHSVELKVGDQLIVYAGGDQIQFGYIDNRCESKADKNGISYPGKESVSCENNIEFAYDCFHLNNNYNQQNPAKLVLNVNDANKEILNAGGFRLKGQDFSIYYINYKASDEDNGLTAKGGTNSDELINGSGNQGPDNPNNPSVYEGTILEDPSNNNGLDLWMDTPGQDVSNPSPNALDYYKITFNQQLSEGDILYFEFWEKYDGSWYTFAIHNPDWTNLSNQNEYKENSYTVVSITLNADEARVINNDCLRVNGYSCKINKIRYKGSNPLTTGGKVVKITKGGSESETVYGESSADKDYSDEEKKQDLMGSINSLAVIKPIWGGVTFSNENKTFTAPQGTGLYAVGVIAQALKDITPGQLSNEIYNGSRDENPNDPLNMFNRWGEVVVELDQAVTGAKVGIFYRDLNYDNYISTSEDEMPVIYNLTGTSISVPLDAYRYIRAIAIGIPAGSSATVNQFFLYEREGYDEDHVEIWVPGEGTNSDPAYEGHFLGAKQMKGNQDNNDWDNGGTGINAWQTAVEIPGSIIAESAKEKAEYQAFAIVYKDATDKFGSNPQAQVYINFPFYQTDKEDGEWKDWLGKYWYAEGDDTSGENSNNKLLFDYLNTGARVADNDGAYTEKGIYAPNIRVEHSLIPYGSGAQIHDGSVYVEVPVEKYNSYNYGTFYIKTSRSIEYPVLNNEVAEKSMKRRAGSSDGVESQEANILDLAKQYGLAIRGQNMTIMKVVYLGAVNIQGQEATEVNITFGKFNDKVDDTNDGNVIRHAFSSDEITLKKILSIDANLEFGKDFDLHLVPATTEAAWQTYIGSNLETHYENLFKEVSVYDSDHNQSALLTQYKILGEDDNVDGFYRGSEFISVEASVNGVASTEVSGSYEYDVAINVPCSGVYNLIFESLSETEGKYDIQGVTTTQVIIYPNITAKYVGKDIYAETPKDIEDYAFNIGGFTFEKDSDGNLVKTGSAYSIKVPEEWVDNTNYAKTVTYIPGIYFANSFSHVESPKNVKKYADEPTAVAEAPGADNYFSHVDLSDLQNGTSTSVEVPVFITKNGATAKYTVMASTASEGFNSSTAVETIGAEDGEAVYFNLQGQKVANPDKGIFVKVQNGKAVKVVI